MSVPTLSYRPRNGATVVDIDRLIASRLLVQANSGAGKSRAIRQLCEETHGRVQHLIIDPEGEFASLRERFDYVIAAGRDGDAAAHPKSARVLCRTLVEVGANAILDLYDLPLEQRREFVRLFLTELMSLPRTMWRPLLVVIDEAHVFVPERGSGESQSTESVITLCTQGRKRGFCAVLATQRISKLHKDAAAELLNKLIGRTGLDVDVKRAGDELGFDKEERQSLKLLQPGEFFTYGPAISQTVTRVRTGAVTTTHPEAGKVGTAPPPPTAAVRKILEQLRDIPAQAEEEARTMADLERKNRELAAQVRKLEKGVSVAAPKIVDRPIIDQAAIDRAVAQVRRQQERMNADAAKLAKELYAIGARLAPVAQQLAERLTAMPAVAVAAVKKNGHAPAPVRREVVRAVPVANAEGLSGTQQRMINAMAFYESIGVDAPTREQVAGYCGVSAAGGSYSNNLSVLRTRGLMIDVGNGNVSLTDEGRAIASVDAPPSLDQLHQTWRSKLSGTQARMLDQIIEAYPNTISREAMADAIGVSAAGGSYSNNLSKLRTLGLMVDVSRSDVKGSDVLFPVGLT